MSSDRLPVSALMKQGIRGLEWEIRNMNGLDRGKQLVYYMVNILSRFAPEIVVVRFHGCSHGQGLSDRGTRLLPQNTLTATNVPSNIGIGWPAQSL